MLSAKPVPSPTSRCSLPTSHQLGSQGGWTCSHAFPLFTHMPLAYSPVQRGMKKNKFPHDLGGAGGVSDGILPCFPQF